MRRILYLTLAIFTIVVAFAAFSKDSKDNSAVDVHTTVKQAASTSSDNNPIIILPKGAYAKWLEEGKDNLLVDGTSPLTTLIVHGADEFDCQVYIDIKARIGGLLQPLLSNEFTLLKQQDYVFPIDIQPATNLHAQQLSYATTIKGSVFFKPVESAYYIKYKLQRRYLVVREQSQQHEIMDENKLVEYYPFGVTTAKEMEKVQAALDILGDEEGVLSGIGSGVYTTEPLEANQ